MVFGPFEITAKSNIVTITYVIVFVFLLAFIVIADNKPCIYIYIYILCHLCHLINMFLIKTLYS